MDVVIKKIDGVEYLYDEYGDYCGVKDMIMSLNQTPIGVWDEENQCIKEHDFKEE